MTTKIKCPKCDEQLNVGELLAQVKSEAKREASRANGKKGGRPRNAPSTQMKKK